jgi:hypothetical protein
LVDPKAVRLVAQWAVQWVDWTAVLMAGLMADHLDALKAAHWAVQLEVPSVVPKVVQMADSLVVRWVAYLAVPKVAPTAAHLAAY